MNARERLLGVLSFEKVDRVPIMDYGYWLETIFAWQKQGLPEGMMYDEEVEEYIGIDKGFEQCKVNGWDKGFDCGIFPRFEQQIIDETEDTVTMINKNGVMLRKLKNNPGMPQFLKYPVETMRDFEKLLWRLDPHNPGRITEKWERTVGKLQETQNPIGVMLPGFYGWPRELMGLENLSIAFYEDPELVHAINKHHVYFIKEHMKIILSRVKVDFACFFEDMAYKYGSLISPSMFRKFMTPYYEEIIDFLRKNHVKKILIDSDGNTVELCSLFLEAGADGHYPCEVNAGSCPLVLRKKYPNLALIGGINKMALIQGREAIDHELEKVPQLLKQGGYIPTVDHRVSPDVSFENYKYYIEKKTEYILKYS